MQNEDCLSRLLVMMILACIVACILPWWLIVIFLTPIIYSMVRLAWKFYQLKRMVDQNDPFNQQSQQTTNTSQTTSTTQSSTKKKVIADDEGEYVDFEEVKN